MNLKRPYAVPAEIPLASEDRSDLIFLERTSLRDEFLVEHRPRLPNEQSKSSKTESMLRIELESESESSFGSHWMTGNVLRLSSSKFSRKSSPESFESSLPRPNAP